MFRPQNTNAKALPPESQVCGAGARLKGSRALRLLGRSPLTTSCSRTPKLAIATPQVGHDPSVLVANQDGNAMEREYNMRLVFN